jgi:Ca2+-transporting ATPase
MALAIGARRMSTEKALIRHLPAVETLGSVTFICADKTGTLTQNKMHAEAIVCSGVKQAVLPGSHEADDAWRHLAQAMALNNDVRPSDQGQMMGDPTEVALLMAAAEAAYDKAALEQQLPRQYELPFDSVRKRMTTIHRDGDHYLAYVKGAPEEVLAECSTAMGIEFDREAILAQAESLAAEGYRVLAYACRTLAEVPTLTPEHIESQLSFLGLVALIDPPRPEVPAAIIDCKTAGITPVMITGDHPATARVIAQRLGLIDHNDAVMTGVELARISDEELRDKISHIRVFARVSPEQKIRIVNALQERGEFVAMTGDGVNDAPALKKSDIGVAMGMKGTDVAREASDMVLLDDNFATIVAAVREGRRIFDNIRKFIKYGMTSNSGEVWTLFLAPFFGLPIPLLPVHILWINLVTDGLPGLALAVEPEEKGIMQRPPRPPNESIFAHGMWQHIIWIGLLIGGLSLVTQAYALHNESPNWQTMVFTTLTFSQLVHAFVIRSEQRSIFSLGLTSNLPLLGAVLLTVGLQLLVIYHPWGNAVFNTQPLALAELGFCVAISFVILIAVELEKWFARQGWIYSADSLT